MTAALHFSGDMMFGNVPFYELSKVTGLEVVNAVGGEKGVRGVPAQRYAGKIKLFGNFELRALFYRFNIKSERFGLGWTLFFDAGRVCADWKKDSNLDGNGAGIKIGAGGGPRILWGDVVVIRADVAYSKDASPVGFYVEATRAF
ncbi:MAG: hypothetical protein JXR91_12010 [Deltaproteobacteria bacterium]|nr:hypothetical protein [Deltaproteobacteria bacterium]